MTDKEKIVAGLECCSTQDCGELNCDYCPYYDDALPTDECVMQLAKDALEFIKKGANDTLSEVKLDDRPGED